LPDATAIALALIYWYFWGDEEDILSAGLVLTGLISAAVSAAIVYLLMRTKILLAQSRAEQLNLDLQASQERAQHDLLAQKESYERLLQEAKVTEEKLQTSFTSLATMVLDRNTARFQESAQKDLKQIQTEGTASFDARVKIFESAVEDLKTRLREANEKILGFERERVDTYARLENQMKQLNEQEQKLAIETERLKSALTTSSSVRGRWGELVLRNILQSSELMQHIDFEEQSVSRSQDGDDLKPDFIIRLPHAGQRLVIDAKTSLYESYLEAESAKTEADRKKSHLEFSKRLRKRIQELGSKEYQKNVTDSAPYVILFVPGEAAIRAAFDADPDIFQFAMDRKVFVASPVTIIPLLLLVANGWRQYKVSSQAAELANVVEQIGDRLNLFVERLSRVQKGLESATRAWNEAIEKSWFGQQSVPRALEKARELGGQIPALAELEVSQLQVRRVDGSLVQPATEIEAVVAHLPQKT